MRTELIVVDPRGVVLGDAGATPIILDGTGVSAGDEAARVPWSEVLTAKLTVPTSGVLGRVWSWVRGLMMAAVFDHIGNSATFTLDIETATGFSHTLEAVCSTTAGYPRREVLAAELLLTRLASDPGCRKALTRDAVEVVTAAREATRAAAAS